MIFMISISIGGLPITLWVREFGFGCFTELLKELYKESSKTLGFYPGTSIT